MDAFVPVEPVRYDEGSLQELLLHAKNLGASDIYIKSESDVRARIHGRLHRLTRRRLLAAEVSAIAAVIYNSANAEVEIRRGIYLDGSYSFRVNRDTTLRFRFNATGTLVGGATGISIVMRELPENPPRLNREDLGDRLYGALRIDDGIVLVCGETGSGKSTLLAGVICDIGEDPDAHAHIITYEHPVEFVFDKVQCPTSVINSTSVPEHVPSFGSAIRNALRRDPTHIIVGEMRDRETIAAPCLRRRPAMPCTVRRMRCRWVRRSRA